MGLSTLFFHEAPVRLTFCGINTWEVWNSLGPPTADRGKSNDYFIFCFRFHYFYHFHFWFSNFEKFPSRKKLLFCIFGSWTPELVNPLGRNQKKPKQRKKTKKHGFLNLCRLGTWTGKPPGTKPAKLCGKWKIKSKQMKKTPGFLHFWMIIFGGWAPEPVNVLGRKLQKL